MCLLFISLFGNRSKRTAREWIFFFFIKVSFSISNSHSICFNHNISFEFIGEWLFFISFFTEGKRFCGIILFMEIILTNIRRMVLFSPQKNRLLLSSITLTRKRMAWPRYRIPFNFQDGMSESMTRESLHGDSVYGLSHTWRQFLLFCSF